MRYNDTELLFNLPTCSQVLRRDNVGGVSANFHNVQEIVRILFDPESVHKVQNTFVEAPLLIIWGTKKRCLLYTSDAADE